MIQYLVQMSGVPGSGKSTVAQGIASHIDAIVLDHDDTKSAIMTTGIESDVAGQASYSVIKVLADKFLARGFSVIIDSPCLYSELLEFGQAMTIKHGVFYRYVECQLDNLEILNHRLLNRESRPSQVKNLDRSISHRGERTEQTRDLFRTWAANMKRPENDYFLIDTSEKPELCISGAVEYVLSRT